MNLSKPDFKLCNVSEILPGTGKAFQIDEKEIGVFNVNGKFYAMNNLCIHAGAPLSDGEINEENCQVSCMWHGWTFDLATGKCTNHARQDVFATCYEVYVSDDCVYLKQI